ncbi:hypothetical protein EYC84_006371 [Monilinia fructicola]|uniref:Uncharacterized protein n=1 Tax=Monilinia fructicola TaxID=38448 RepID=A0A5M9K6X3_MONFR|nr:hypothetical protein EYC84_006371 [Monilinia fructicola]
MPPRNQTSIPTEDDEASLISSQSTRNKIESDRAKRIKDVRRRLEALYENRRARKAKLQKAEWTRLRLLNEKRHELEDQILNSMMLIESPDFCCLKIRKVAFVIQTLLNIIAIHILTHRTQNYYRALEMGTEIWFGGLVGRYP